VKPAFLRCWTHRPHLQGGRRAALWDSPPPHRCVEMPRRNLSRRVSTATFSLLLPTPLRDRAIFLAHQAQKQVPGASLAASGGSSSDATAAAPAATTTGAASTGPRISPSVNQWLARGHLSPSHIARSDTGSASDDEDTDVSSSGDEGNSSSSSEDEEEEEDIEAHPRQWDVRVTGAQNVRVAVQYERAPLLSPHSDSSADAGASLRARSAAHLAAAAAAVPVSPSTAALERARLYPHGLPGASPSSSGGDGSNPGAATSLSSFTPLASGLPRDRPPPPAAAAGAASSARWDSSFVPSEEDARRMERIARIMREHHDATTAGHEHNA